MEFEKLVTEMKTAPQRVRALLLIQKLLLVLCALLLIAGVTLKLKGGLPDPIMVMGLVAGLCGLGGALAGKKADSIRMKIAVVLEAIERFEASKPKKIPLTIGFANLSGGDLNAAISEDSKALIPLFARSRIVANHEIPTAEVLFIYAHLNQDGTLKGTNSLEIRQFAQLANASIIVLASPNSADSVQYAASLPGPKTANIVFTLNRNGDSFARFFTQLFQKMGSGQEMMSAWVELAPQGPNQNSRDIPGTILLAGNKLGFPRP